MKKISYLLLLGLVALASCSKQEEVQTPNVTNTGTEEETGINDADDMSGEELNSNIEVSETNSGETMIIDQTGSTSSGTTEGSGSEEAQKVGFNLPYTLPNGMNVSLSGYLEVKNGTIVGVGGMEKAAEGYQQAFAKGLGDKVIGKEIKGLQVDTVSGASLATAAFNKYLKDNYS